MSRIEVASAALILAGVAPVAHFLQAVEPTTEAFASTNRQILWRPDSTGANAFGFIPTQWTARPQLLPLTWDVQTVFASDGMAKTRPALPGLQQSQGLLTGIRHNGPE
jgi:hypothetical protein